MNLENKVVVITGAGSGIGEACAILFAKHGSTVVLADINLQKAEEVAEKIQAMGGKSSPIKMDVTNFQEVESKLQKVIDSFGKIDIMVNNAGIMNQLRAPTAEHTFEDWDQVIAINQTGVFYCLKACLKHMMQQGYGSIVNMASLAGLKASGFNLAYSASKFAVVGMTKSAAMEYAPHNIRINAVCPSYTQTPMLDAVVEKQPGIDKKLLRFVPMGRFAEADEIADAVIWLSSDHSKFITGQTITVDGGLSL
jgi:NAD(P)-dependent dehydrogenase (short-subunit alcohol dehydrogenase family)